MSLIHRSSAAGRIHSPEDGQRVPRQVTVTGELSGIPSNRSVWIAVEIGALLWPKVEISATEESWTRTLEEESASDAPYGLVLLMVNRGANRRIRRWLSDGPRYGFPGFPDIQGSVSLDSVRGISLSSASQGDPPG